MFVGKYSALKGFSLFFYVVCMIMTLVGCITTGDIFFIIPAILVTAAGYYAMQVVVKHWNGECGKCDKCKKS